MANGSLPRRRSLAGPVILILLGVMFLLGTMHVLSFGSLAIIYAKYWPLIIILWGVIKLVEYQQAKREGVPPRGIGAGGVVGLIFLIMFGLAATRASNVNWSEIPGAFNIDDEDVSSLFGETFTFDDTLEQNFPAGSSLHIVNDRGNINVSSVDGDKIRVLVHKKIGASDQKEADKYNQQTKPQITISDKIVSLNANTQGAGNHGVQADLEIFLPAKAALVVSSRRGDVTILAREGDVEVSSQKGEVTLEDITGNAKTTLERSTLHVSRVSGDVSVDGRANDLTVAEVKGAVRLTGEYFGSIDLSRIAKAVSFKSSRTDMEFSSLQGSLNFDGSDMHGDSLTGPLRLLTRSKDIRLDGISGDARVSNSNGTVELRVSRVPVGTLDIDNRDSDVQIYLPDQSGFRVSANADNGEVQTDFSSLQIKNDDDRGSASGTVGNGAGMLKISNRHGGIEIRKGSSMAEAPPTPPELPNKVGPPSTPRIPRHSSNSEKQSQQVQEF